MATSAQLAADLHAEFADLDAVLRGRSAADWELPTPAEGWSVRDQVAHLAYFDEVALLAMTRPEEFRVLAAAHLVGGMDFPDRLVDEHRTAFSIPQLHQWFVGARTRLAATARSLDARTRVPWYGPDMSVASALTARIMETWAHGQDVADAFGVTRSPTPRLRHVAHIGVGAMNFSFAVRGLAPPAQPVHVALLGPDGETWRWGPADAENVVRGDALEFCLLVTQRRHRDDTDLEVSGPVAEQWTATAQAFAGGPGPGRAPMAGRRQVHNVRNGPESNPASMSAASR